MAAMLQSSTVQGKQTYAKVIDLIYQLYFIHSFEKVKSFTVPTNAYSASLHPNMSAFVVGGEDFKIYKIAYEDGRELGKIHICLNFYLFLFLL